MFQFDGPHLVTVGQSTVDAGAVSLTSNTPIAELSDPEDGTTLGTDTTTGHLDHALDVDYFDIELKAGDTVTVTIDTINFDPGVVIDHRNNTAPKALAGDDDSGGGVFGVNARASYTAVVPGRYIIALDDVEM